MSRRLPPALAGCNGKPTGAGSDTTVRVTYADAIERENIDYEEYTGRTVAVESVEVWPQVTARIEAVLFEDGEIVEKGQHLYRLDDRPFKAVITQAEATIKSSQARVDQ